VHGRIDYLPECILFKIEILFRHLSGARLIKNKTPVAERILMPTTGDALHSS
jgi:hypothetical protein